MNVGDIAFPHLGIYLKNVPKTFEVFGITVAFYGLIIAIGVVAGIMLAVRQAKISGQNPDIIWDFAMYAVIISVICARLYYVIFSWDNYKDDLFSIFQIRNGGLAIYGGVIGAFSTLFVYCKAKKINPFVLGDMCIPGLLIGQIIGRWGNFMNREAFGDYSDGLLAMRLPISAVRYHEITDTMKEHIVDGINYIQVHPTFLYESLWNVCVLSFMLWYRKHKKFDGELLLVYLGGYGFGRALIEGLRTDQLLLGGTGIAVSQLLSVCLVILAVVVDVAVRINLKKKIITEDSK